MHPTLAREAARQPPWKGLSLSLLSLSLSLSLLVRFSSFQSLVFFTKRLSLSLGRSIDRSRRRSLASQLVRRVAAGRATTRGDGLSRRTRVSEGNATHASRRVNQSIKRERERVREPSQAVAALLARRPKLSVVSGAWPSEEAQRNAALARSLGVSMSQSGSWCVPEVCGREREREREREKERETPPGDAQAIAAALPSRISHVLFVDSDEFWHPVELDRALALVANRL